MNKIAFLTMDSLENFECYDHLLFDPFEKSGWKVDEISWRKENVNWNDYKAVIVRSTWDYQNDPTKFINVLEGINNSSAVLFNDLQTLKWNMNKAYLHDLQQRGVLIVQTLWQNEFTEDKLSGYFDILNTDEIIIKPNISANADNTFHLNKYNFQKLFLQLSKVFSEKEFMVQPFIKNILTEGEYSLFYFDGEYSHTILKTPKQNDFRVQEEHGGIIKVVISNGVLQDAAKLIISKLAPVPLYARVDLVRTDSNQFALMELELIEPSLYFNLDLPAAERFVQAFNKVMAGKANHQKMNA